nr:MAG TPA: hypothetical protein [Caudoviricetes sp.]
MIFSSANPKCLKIFGLTRLSMISLWLNFIEMGTA